MMLAYRSVALVALLCALVLAGPGEVLAKTYYVDAAAGNDLNTTTQAQSAATPWQTIKRALSTAVGGDTILVQPGTYTESIQSKRDGTSTAPVILKSVTVGAAIIQPPSGTLGILVYNNYQVIDGFTITGATTGIKAGPHLGNNGDPIVSLLIQNNTIFGNSSNGIQITTGLTSEIAYNAVYQNGGNGINYDGNSSLIHGNVVHDNGQFGIYIKSGVDHQVYDNQVYSNTGGNLQVVGTLLPMLRTYYVDALLGNDLNTPYQATFPATPWKTIKNAMLSAQPGDTVLVQPGVYAESVESKRDGAAGNPITLRAVKPGTVTVQPPAGSNGFVVQHHYHTIDGFTITGATNGIQHGPHDGNSAQPIYGLIATNNRVYGNSGAGIKFTNADGGVATHNLAYSNGQEGILYGSTGAAANATIFNNLVYGNGLNNQGKFGITLGGGSGHKVTSNTVYGNVIGGILVGTNSGLPVFATVLNNIVANNGTGIKELGNSTYTGQAVLDYNDVYGNTTNYSLNATTGTVAGPNSISAAPVFVDAANSDFRLGRVASGQLLDSPCIDRGSDTAANVGLGNRTAFSDKYPDNGRVDLGYHGTLVYPAQGTLTVSQLLMHLNPAAGGDDFFVTFTLQPGTGSDGMDLGVNYTELSLGTLVFPMPIKGFASQGGGQWLYTGSSGAVTTATLQKLGDGSVTATIQGAGLNLLFNDAPTTIGFKVGDDFGSVTVPLRGTLLYP